MAPREAQVERSTYLDAPPDRVSEEVNQSRLLLHISAPLLNFRPIDRPSFPERFAEARYLVAMRLFGVLPLGRQEINVSHPTPEGTARSLRDNGQGGMVRKWDHLIVIAPEGGGTRYTDRVTISAGILTPIVVAFARYFYAHRQRRWRQLAASGFVY